MDAAKDLLKRAVELDSAQRYSEAIICYEEGIQNILRAITGRECIYLIDIKLILGLSSYSSAMKLLRL